MFSTGILVGASGLEALPIGPGHFTSQAFDFFSAQFLRGRVVSANLRNTSEFRDVVFVTRFYLIWGHVTIIIKHHILEHHIPELPKYLLIILQVE